MDKLKNYIIFSLVILILLGLCTLFGYLYYNEKNKTANQIISTITEVQIDTIQFTDSLFYPVPVIIEKPIYDSIIDTVYVINDYYTGKIYEYNFKDSNLSIKSNIIIHKNQLVSLFNEYEIYRKTTTITNTITQPEPEFMALIGAGFDVYNYKLGLNLTAGVYYKKNIVSIYYDPLLKSFGIVYKRAIIIK
jgi:hypothetical protein